jgi:hypothetical protein
MSVLKRTDVIDRLKELGYKEMRPINKTWSHALIASNKSHTIYILIRKRGIDFKLYDGTKENEIDEKGHINTNDGTTIRNNYCESYTNIHELTLKIASLFITDTPLDKSLMSDHGKPVSLQKADYLKNLSLTAKSEGRQMYDAMAHEDGEDAYLGGGMWISSDGSLSDRGR